MSVLYQFQNPKASELKLSEDTIAVVLHGGGGIAFGESHSLIQFLYLFTPKVISVELPNHGRKEKDEKYILIEILSILTLFDCSLDVIDTNAAREDLKNNLLRHITGKKVFFIAYSVGMGFKVFFTSNPFIRWHLTLFYPSNSPQIH